jgi:hypothetical protein
MQIREEEVKLLPLVDDIILHVENPKKLTNELGKFAEYKVII